MSVAQDRVWREQFLAAVCLNLANLGSPEIMWDFIAQMICSYVAAGTSPEDHAAMYAGVMTDIGSRTAELFNNGGIWDELMPGPVRDDEHHEWLMYKINHMMTESCEIDGNGKIRFRDIVVDRMSRSSPERVEIEGQDLDAHPVWVQLHTTNAMGNAIQRELSSKNIKLCYPVVLRRTVDQESEALYADSCEFFMDEHGFQWVKFTPSNGYDSGRETMWRVDCNGFSIARRTNAD